MDRYLCAGTISMKRYKFFVFLLFPLFFSCSEKNEEQPGMVFQTDFESLPGWLFDQRLLKGEAHSGEWMSRADPQFPFSITFKRRLGDISNRPIRKIMVSAWVKTQTIPTKASLVISIDAGNNPVFWKAESLENQISEKEKWTEVAGEFDIPLGDIGPDHVVKFYIWNTDNSMLHVDDMRIVFEN